MTESEFTIYKISQDKIRELVELENAAFKGSGEDIYTLVMIAEIGWVYASLTNIGGLTGAIEILPTNNPSLAFIHGLVVEPEWQYNGVGTTLLNFAEIEAKNLGFTRLACTIATTNGPSLNTFINKSGFTATGFHFNYYGQGEHRLWVEKNISQQSFVFPEKEIGAKISSGLEMDGKYVLDDDFAVIDHLLNWGKFKVTGVIRPLFSGLPKNCLFVSKV